MRFTYIMMAVVLALFGGIGILLASKNSAPAPDQNTINTYSECVSAGGAILESYPDQCVSPTGSGTFTNPAQAIDLPATAEPTN